MDIQDSSNNRNPSNNQNPLNNQFPPGYQSLPVNQYQYNYRQYQRYPYPQQHHYSASLNPSGRNKAIASLALGIAAIWLPIPFLDLVAGIIGLVLALKAKNEGFSGGLQTGGFVLSIIGVVFGFFYTLFWIFFGSIYIRLFSEMFNYLMGI